MACEFSLKGVAIRTDMVKSSCLKKQSATRNCNPFKQQFSEEFMSFRMLIAAAATILIAGPALADSGPLAEAEWLSQNLENPKVRIFEVSVDTGIYERGHVPGAVNLNWHTDLVDTVSRDIVSREKFEEILEAAGIAKDTTIVLYGDNNNWFAAWGAWVFNIYGMGDQVKLLDGGRKYWEAKGLPLDTSAPSYQKTDLTLPERDTALRARLSDVLDVAEKRKDSVIVDIRSPDEYSGKLVV
jgi:thiosulfate/3-mercaptopyruvate sulfurtransferase